MRFLTTLGLCLPLALAASPLDEHNSGIFGTSHKLKRYDAPSCGIVGDKPEPFRTRSTKCRLYNCRDLCAATEGCESYAIGNSQCLLFSTTVAVGFVPDPKSAFTFYDVGCVKATSTGIPTTSETEQPTTTGTSTSAETPIDTTTETATESTSVVIDSTTTTSSETTTDSTTESTVPTTTAETHTDTTAESTTTTDATTTEITTSDTTIPLTTTTIEPTTDTTTEPDTTTSKLTTDSTTELTSTTFGTPTIETTPVDTTAEQSTTTSDIASTTETTASSTPTASLTQYLLRLEKTDGSTFGYVSADIPNPGYTLYGDASGGVKVSFSSPPGALSVTQVDLIHADPPNAALSGLTHVGAVGGSGNTGSNFGADVLAYAYLTATASTPPGSPSLPNIDQALLRYAGYGGSVQSAIWSINLVTLQVSPVWVNTDGSSFPATVFWNANVGFVGITGSLSKFSQAYPNEAVAALNLFLEEVI